MAWISATRTTLRSVRYLPGFLIGSVRSSVAARRTPGFVTGRVQITVRGELFTLSVWESPQAMRSFRDDSAHGRLMPRLAAWADEGSYTGWRSATRRPPSWRDVLHRLADDGTFGEVDRPSVAHLERRLPTTSAPGLTLAIPGTRASRLTR